MTVTRSGLKKPLKEGDYDGLVEVMGHLMKVKERQVATDSMFEPLKQTIELLKTYGEEMPEETYLKLQVGTGGLCRVTAGSAPARLCGPRGQGQPIDSSEGLKQSPCPTSLLACGGHARRV